ncbi:MAG: serine/threonine-protein phosphatase [Treponema sp.]|nr:serine/threonine-protein phosphatase [Treponema sp.]
MYKSKRRTALISVYVLIGLIFTFLAVFLVPQTKPNDFSEHSNFFTITVAAVLFCMLALVGSTIYTTIRQSIEKKSLNSRETAFLSRFIDRIRFSYSLEDFYNAISSILEEEADCSVLYIDSKTDFVRYNSPNRLTSSQETIDKLAHSYPADWPEGYFYLDNNFGISSKSERARGFFLSTDSQHLFVLCRYTHLFDNEIYGRLLDEFSRFQARANIISNLSEISELSKEWETLAQTQRSFLPQVMPEVPKVKFGAYFRPLINVSGDYYTVLPIDEHKTFIMLGDGSGKGMAAALVMGLVLNTVKIRENKEDLVGTLNAIDKAIKNMSMQDKYTVLFMGILDTQKMTLRYINASMSDPIIVTRSPNGYRIKPLSSNCSIVGIIPLDDIQIAEQRLFSGDLILMASDGVSEVMNDEGIELGDTEYYTDTIKQNAGKDPQDFIEDIVELVIDYNGNKKLRDDVTMLVAKIQG